MLNIQENIITILKHLETQLSIFTLFIFTYSAKVNIDVTDEKCIYAINWMKKTSFNSSNSIPYV